ncbi:MAG TPA: hypothetical protein VNT55_24760 [Baekduia sp.]|nr:hypothetical protein [Baekduia sp.]
MGRRPHVNRKSAMRVVDGQVRRKNNWVRDAGDYMVRYQDEIVLDRRDPGSGYRHVLTIADVRAFLDLLPAWDDVAIGLDAIVLDHDPSALGWHTIGVVALCSWERDLWWRSCSPEFFAEHREVFDLFGVEHAKRGPRYELRWTEEQVRAFQLVYVLAHELGHHRDRVTTRNLGACPRGEPYAEAYARRSMREVWPVYARRFGL